MTLNAARFFTRCALSAALTRGAGVARTTRSDRARAATRVTTAALLAGGSLLFSGATRNVSLRTQQTLPFAFRRYTFLQRGFLLFQ